MSLIVTSNVAMEDTPEFSNSNKPYSYSNRLLNTMRIPPMSEIALQSAKINKNGLFVLDRSNSGFCHYFGPSIGDGADEVPDLDSSTTQPFRAVIGAGDAFRAGDEKNELNVEDMAVEIEKGFNNAVFHPAFITGENSKGTSVETLYDSDFKGFKFTTTQQTAKTTRNAASITFTDISANNSLTGFNQNAGVVTTTNTNGFYVQNREYPISQNAGTCTFNFSEANIGPWMVGLSRINTPINTANGYEYVPNYYNLDVNPQSGLRLRGTLRYGDIIVMRDKKVGGRLRVFQSGSRTDRAYQGIEMNEIDYTAGNADFNELYDIETNTDEYRKVKFTLTGEQIKIELIDAADTAVLLCDFTTVVAAGAVKNECVNPMNAAKWALYPVCAASGNFAEGARSITLESIDHYTNYPSYDEDNYYNYDWWGWSQKYNQTAFCKSLELRPWNDRSKTTLLTPKGVNGSGGMEDYNSHIITARSRKYGSATDLCNTQNTLGFMGDPVSRPATGSGNLITVIESSSPPKLVSNISLFVRLNNFTQNTMNARQGTLSKIVAHLPRFDNSGNETGGLYFEPTAGLVYLSLNNQQELLINSFDVDIVYENETLCTALTGKTVVCFHVRQQKM